MPGQLDLLRQLRFGARVAEEEATEIGQYYVETDQWQRMYAGQVDVVYRDIQALKDLIAQAQKQQRRQKANLMQLECTWRS